MIAKEPILTRCQIIIQSLINEIYMFDAETYKFIDCNESSLKNLGYTIEEMREMTPLNIKIDYTLEQFKELIQPLYEGENYVEFVTTHRRKDSTFYNVNVKLQLIIEDDISIITAIIEDITEKLSAEISLEIYKEQLEELIKTRTEELHAAMDLYKTLARMSPVGIMRTNGVGGCDFVNKKWCELTGLTKEESKDMGWMSAIYTKDLARVKAGWMNSVVNNENWSEEFRVIDKEGNIFWVLCSGNAVNGINSGHVVTFTNITKKKEILPQLLDLQELIKNEAIKRGTRNGG